MMDDAYYYRVASHRGEILYTTGFASIGPREHIWQSLGPMVRGTDRPPSL